MDRAQIMTIGKAAAVPLALLASGALVLQGSSAAFSGSTSNPGNAWATGAVTLTDDDGGGANPAAGTAMFTATALKPGSTGNKCIVVTSTSTVAAALKLYSTGVTTTNALSSHLNLRVEEGTGGSFGSCTGFTPVGAATFDGTLATFGTANGGYATGVGNFALAGTPTETRSYRITYTVSAAAPNSAANGTAAATFVWEAQTNP